MKLTATGVLAVVGLAAGVIGIIVFLPDLKALLATKLNPVSRENLAYQVSGEVGLKIADWFGGLFKSDAEREVDAMLRAPPRPKMKSVVTPAMPQVNPRLAR